MKYFTKISAASRVFKSAESFMKQKTYVYYKFKKGLTHEAAANMAKKHSDEGSFPKWVMDKWKSYKQDDYIRTSKPAPEVAAKVEKPAKPESGQMELFKESAKKKEDSNVGRNVAIGAGVATGIGAGTSAILPQLKGGRKGILGALTAAKRMFVDVPLHYGSMGALGKHPLDAIGMARKARRMHLTPSEIINRSVTRLKHEMKPEKFKRLNNVQRRELSKKFDRESMVTMMAEQEQAARAAGETKIYGISHFTPQTAALAGYSESPVVSQGGNKFLFKTLGRLNPFNYYGPLKAESATRLKTKGKGGLNAMDAYWLTAPHSNLRVFEKDLTKGNKSSVVTALKQVKEMKVKNPARLKQLNLREKQFKHEYDNFIIDIAKAKDKKGKK